MPRSLIPLIAAVGLSGCSFALPEALDFNIDTRNVGAELSYDQNNPIAVRVAPRVLEIPVETAALSDPRRAVTNFGREFLTVGRGPLQIAYPGGPDAAARAAGAAAAETAARQLIAEGVPVARLAQGPYDPNRTERRGLVLSFSAPTAFSAGCPRDWGDPTRSGANTTPERFGCARQNNLAAMIARPSDLVEPRPLSPASPARRAGVLEAYAKGEDTASKGAQATSTTN